MSKSRERCQKVTGSPVNAASTLLTPSPPSSSQRDQEAHTNKSPGTIAFNQSYAAALKPDLALERGSNGTSITDLYSIIREDGRSYQGYQPDGER
jgi:hypothetical protein